MGHPKVRCYPILHWQPHPSIILTQQLSTFRAQKFEMVSNDLIPKHLSLNMYFRFAFLFGAFAAHTTAQDLTQEQLDFIRANAAAVEAALQSGRTRRENEVRF